MTSAPEVVLLTDPVTLENAHVRLEPLAAEHAPDLRQAAEGLEHAWYTSVPSPAGVDAEIAQRQAWRKRGEMNPWAILRADTGVAVGMTTFCNIDQANRHVEIGYTWLSVAAQRTAVNTAAKLLLLGHAFEACDAIAVEFRTHFHNRQSRAAIERLGAKLDGILRNHRLGPDGSLRDTAVYSLLPHEWPAARLGLQARLRRG
ncbi:GNAT family protein [Microbacterium sp. ET2]|uniref:GNAT family N-acetyltransferase n=1 Tax=Microbacterium albipurpureum TaxID=3050384 RepID=UPI00259CF1CC|nr:GNAT family protein [Microbacterium sp. ET2 (Ac-2212)]WJL95061.1 GNAT family protein [Microbacterium sp. ET2 (Ac-2212)]